MLQFTTRDGVVVVDEISRKNHERILDIEVADDLRGNYWFDGGSWAVEKPGNKPYAARLEAQQT